MRVSIDKNKKPSNKAMVGILEFAIHQLSRTPYMIDLSNSIVDSKRSDTIAMGAIMANSAAQNLETFQMLLIHFPKEMRLHSSDNPTTIWADDNVEKFWVHQSLQHSKKAKQQNWPMYYHFPLTPNTYCQIRKRADIHPKFLEMQGDQKLLDELNRMTRTTSKKFIIK